MLQDIFAAEFILFYFTGAELEAILQLQQQSHFVGYSQTSLYRTRIIRTSTYIEVALWSQLPAIVTGGKMHRIYRTLVLSLIHI